LETHFYEGGNTSTDQKIFDFPEATGSTNFSSRLKAWRYPYCAFRKSFRPFARGGENGF
jgi:hypothetical protein